MSIRTAVFGGAFDPPHIGHVIGITMVLNSGLADKILVIPSGEREDKKYRCETSHRVAMAALMVTQCFTQQDPVTLDTSEADGAVQHPGTVGLMEYLRQRDVGIEPYFVIGSELVQDLPSWREADRLRKEVKFLVIERKGRPLSGPLPAGFDLTTVPNPEQVGMEISSSYVRSLLSDGVSPAGLVPRRVLEYVYEHRLFGVPSGGRG